jgi:hypothetical protein
MKKRILLTAGFLLAFALLAVPAWATRSRSLAAAL